MLKNHHIFFCSLTSFLAMYLFFFQDTGMVAKTLYVDNLCMMLSFMTLICLLSISWLTCVNVSSKYLTLINISMLIVFNYLYMLQNFFLFYIMFEISVVPMMFYISSWGYSLDRIKAMMYMFMYTFFFSLPFIMILMYMAKISNSNIMKNMFFMNNINDMIVLLCLTMFLVKIPVWGFHLWLPKAHVEASTEGSMILAGVVLKLAGIGLIKFLSYLILMKYNTMIFFIASMSMMGAIFMGLYCTRQSDAKVIIALSSVVHMSFLFICFMMGTSLSITAMLIVMVAHGIISPLMFMFLGEVYNTISSRSLQYLKGVLKNILYICLLWFLLCMFNMGLPLSMNFFGEIMFFFSSNSFSLSMTLIVSSLIFINGFFNSFLLIFLSGGKEKDFTYTYSSNKTLLLMYMLLIFIILITPNMMNL